MYMQYGFSHHTWLHSGPLTWDCFTAGLVWEVPEMLHCTTTKMHCSADVAIARRLVALHHRNNALHLIQQNVLQYFVYCTGVLISAGFNQTAKYCRKLVDKALVSIVYCLATYLLASCNITTRQISTFSFFVSMFLWVFWSSKSNVNWELRN